MPTDTVFDCMFSTDIFVEDMGLQARLFVEHFGVHAPGPKAIVTDSPEAHATMLRLHKSFAEAPTRLEIIQPAGKTGHWNVAQIQQAWHSQRERPVRFHNNVVLGDVDALIEALRSRSIPHIVDGTLSFRRLFVGIDPVSTNVYDPKFDAGLRFEVLPFTDFPVQAASGADQLGDGPPRLVRVLSRSFLVEDLDAVTGTLETTFGWQPASRVHSLPADGVRRAIYKFRLPRSARLELLQPERDGTEAARFAASHGAGPYTTTFLVTGVDRWVDRLSQTGIRARRVADHDEYGPRVIVDPSRMGPIRAELVGVDPWARS